MLLALLTLLPALAGGVADARSQVLANPESAEAWVALGDAYKKAWKKKKARAAYFRAQGLAPEDLDVQARVAELGGGRTRLERKAMRRLNDDEVWGDLGDEYLASGRREDALAAYRYALSIDPEDGEWQGKITQLLGPEELLAALESGDTDLGDEELGDMADALAAQGELERACELYTRASELDPADSEWLEKLSSQCGVGFGYGIVEGVAGGGSYPGEAGMDHPYADLAAIETSTVAPGSDAEALAVAGRAFALMGERGRALDFYTRALQLAPTDEKLRTAVHLLGDEPLVEILEGLVLREPESDELWGDLGDAYAAVGKPDEAAGAWARAHELDPEDDEWGYKLGLVDPDRLSPDPAAESMRELLESE